MRPPYYRGDDDYWCASARQCNGRWAVTILLTVLAVIVLLGMFLLVELRQRPPQGLQQEQAILSTSLDALERQTKTAP